MNSLTIQVDSREKARAITKIIAEFERQGIKYYISKLWTGDYMSLDNPRLIIDRKQSLSETCSNVCQQHVRFRKELVRANEMGIKLIILVEHGGNIKSLEDVKSWINPRIFLYEKKIRKEWNISKDADFQTEITELKSHGAKIVRGPTTGEELYKAMVTMQEKYGCQFVFTDKKSCGQIIIELLGGDSHDD
jgi:hypothetical protein